MRKNKMIYSTLQASWLRHFVFFAVMLLCVVEYFATDDDGMYLNQFAIRVENGKRETAEEVARDHGFTVTGELPNINVFLLEHTQVEHRSKRSIYDKLEILQNDHRVSHAQQEAVLDLSKRHVIHQKDLQHLPKSTTKDTIKDGNVTHKDDASPRHNITFNDPKFKDMWYLINNGQKGGEVGLDLNVAVVWQNGFTGKGVVISILDDGVEYTHPDLRDNYDPKASTDLNDRNDTEHDPMPDTSKPGNGHGTMIAGVIAAKANNSVCCVGVAYNAHIGGVRVLDGRITDSLVAEALNFNMNYIDIYLTSWGPKDNGRVMEGPHHYSLEAFRRGAREGRNGRGSIFIFASGNGGADDDCGADGYVSLPETMPVGSVTNRGNSPQFDEHCSSKLVVVPTGGVRDFITTTGLNDRCTGFGGTSSAAPLAAGCIATVLQANPLLTWRDVQHIVVRTSRIPSADDSWTINGAGYHVSPRFGFGLMDCGKMVELAQNWQNVPERRLCNTTKTNYQVLSRDDKIVDSMDIEGCEGEYNIDHLEHVQVHIKMSTDFRGETEIFLISPANTRSRLLSPRRKDNATGEWEFTFLTVHSWDERPTGTWTLEIMNIPQTANKIKDDMNSTKKEAVGSITEWSLLLWGTYRASQSNHTLDVKRTQKASYPSVEEILAIKRDEFEMSKIVEVKRRTML